MITGKNTIMVKTMAINVYSRLVPIIKKAITKAATANAMPTA